MMAQNDDDCCGCAGVELFHTYNNFCSQLNGALSLLNVFLKIFYFILFYILIFQNMFVI